MRKSATGGSGSVGGGATWRYVLYGLVLAGLLGGYALSRLADRPEGLTFREAPVETRGRWTTTDPRYAGRAIEVTATAVGLVLGDDGSVPGRLVIARELFDDDERYLRLEYESANGSDALEMVVSASGTMRLRNQPDIEWTSDKRIESFDTSPAVAIDEGEGGLTPLVLLGVAALLLIVVLLLVSGRGSAPGVALGEEGEDEERVRAEAIPGVAPPAIRGVWTTPDPRFDTQSVRIGANYGFAQFGPGEVRVGGRIVSVDEAREDGGRSYRVTFRTREGPHVLVMHVDRSGHLRLGGGRTVWVRGR